jgi:hypothetical protein
MFQTASDHHQYCADFRQSCCQDTVYQDQSHLLSNSTKKYQHFKNVAFKTRHRFTKRLIYFDFVLLWLDSRLMVPWGPKHVAMLSVML